MAQVVDKAKRKLQFLLFAFITPVGIFLLVLYTKILIPGVNFTIIKWALGFMAPVALGLILVHDLVLMKKRWDTANSFLDEGEASGHTAQEALVAMLEFPIKMPLFGWLIWFSGGVAASVGAYVGTEGRVNPIDLLFMLTGIVTASAIITIFQIFYWRDILDPIVGSIIHKHPEVLDQEIPAYRTNLQSTLMIGLIPLVTLSVLISTIGGYRQASTALQDSVGKRNLLRLDKMWEEDLSKLETEEAILAYLSDPEVGHGIEPFTPYMIKVEDGVYTELIRGIDYSDHLPDVGIEILEDKMAENGGYVYDLFNLEIVSGIPVLIEGEVYYLLIGLPWDHYSGNLFWLKFYSILLMCAVVALSALVVKAIAKEISQPVNKLVDFAESVGSGVIHTDVYYHANDEVGDLALSMRTMSGRLGEVLNRISGAAESLDDATRSIKMASESVDEGARMQDEAIDDVASAMDEMDATIQGIADNVEVLSSSAEESSSSIFEMSAAVKKINESVDVLNQSINEVSSSINEMTAAMDQVADNVGNLSAVAEETASSMAQMDASIREVDKNTKDTAEWSEQVINAAETGVETVGRVTNEMHQISEVVHAAQQVIERLGGRVDEIGKIVKVIDDVANQTNLLALNAAIIAAQAGEHGRGFAVVADEIKQLAERTSGSTREIHQLIRGVQEESHQAVGAVEAGARAVEDGVKMAEQASGSLAKIMESTQTAIKRVQGIARTTQEQSESSAQVSKAIERVADMVNQISVATQQQSRGGNLILKATEEMKAASLQVKRNAEEQLAGSKLITKSVENITDMLYSINQSQQEQKRGSAQVVQLMERIKVVSGKSTDSAKRLAEVVNALSNEGNTLREQIKRFRIDSNGNGNGKPD